jgi:hypothetical protein
MAGISIEGFIGRVTCPHCGDTDCCGYDGDALICCKTGKRFNDAGLRASARAAKLPEYTEHQLANGWTGKVITSQGQGQHPAGAVHLHSEKGHRGVAPTLEAAQAFAESHQDPGAYWSDA